MQNWTSTSTKDISYLQERLNYITTQGREIQKNFEFIIPNYVLEEIVDTQNKQQKTNLSAIINLAKINKRLTEEQANKLKEAYCH